MATPATSTIPPAIPPIRPQRIVRSGGLGGGSVLGTCCGVGALRIGETPRTSSAPSSVQVVPRRYLRLQTGQ